MVRRRGHRGLELAIKGFVIDDFSLAGGILKEGVGEGDVFVEDGDFSLDILTGADLSIAEGIGGTIGLDLVDDLVELHGEVLGEGAVFLIIEDEVQVFGLKQGAVGVMTAAGCDGEAAVEVFSELTQIGIASRHIRNAV